MAEKKSIHEFSTGTPQAQTAFVVDTPNASAESGYVTEKVITSDLGNTLLGTLNYTQSLNTESKNIFGAVNELNENVLKTKKVSGTTGEVAADGSGQIPINFNLPSGSVVVAVIVMETKSSSRFPVWVANYEDTYANIGYLNHRAGASTMDFDVVAFYI